MALKISTSEGLVMKSKRLLGRFGEDQG